MFWRFGGHASISSLDQVLDKPGVTLEDLLDESDLIQELKQQNSKLIEFLREDNVLQQLLRYVIADAPAADESPVSPQPTEEDVSTGLGFFGKVNARSRSKSAHKEDDDQVQKSEAQRRKYAYVACEILSSEIWSITEALLAEPDHLRDFWDYLRRPAPLDPLQAGYFTKINETLLDKKTEDMVAFLQTLDAVVPEMLKHVDCPMIMDLLLKMISLEKHDGGQGIVDWLQSQNLLLILLSYLSPDNPASYQTSAGDFLKAIITISANATAQDQTVIGPNELTRQLVSRPCVDQLMNYMLTGGNPLTVGVGIVIEVIRKNNSDYDGEFQPGPEPRTSDPIYLGTLLRAFSENVHHFMQLVRGPSATKPQLKTAFGDSVQPLGFDRFKTCELMAELLHCSNMGLLNERGSDEELVARDTERQRLRAAGMLPSRPRTAIDDATDQYGSSVDSHGFHHAEAPAKDDLEASPVTMNRLEVQNASDEDGFENLAVPEAEPLPDEVNFDDLLEKPTSPTEPQSHDITNNATDVEMSDDPAPVSEGTQRVASLTKRIEQEIEDTAHSSHDEAETARTSDSNAAQHPEDRPAPLFARSPTAQADDGPGLDGSISLDGPDAHIDEHSINTLLADEDGDQSPDTDDDCMFERDTDGSPVIGDLLKMQFVEHQVVPTILDFFFRFPWNNFLHNVVYDVVQQVFNGVLDRGYNRILARDLFNSSDCSDLSSQADVVKRILDGQGASEKSQAEKGLRLGYMGHLTLIAEEVCKFVDRHDPEFLGADISEKINGEAWQTYVNGTLIETRERDNTVLGGMRPDAAGGMRPASSSAAMLAPVSISNSGNSSALADAGLAGGSTVDELSLSEPDSGAGYDGESNRELLSSFTRADDDDEEEEEEVDDQLGDTDERVRGLTLEDDEQQSQARLTFSNAAQADNVGTTISSTLATPPPLNIPPSRARKQLAARLAARKKEAESSALQDGSSSPDPLSASPTAASPVLARLRTDVGSSPSSSPVRRQAVNEDPATAAAADAVPSSPTRFSEPENDRARLSRLFRSDVPRTSDSDDSDSGDELASSAQAEFVQSNAATVGSDAAGDDVDDDDDEEDESDLGTLRSADDIFGPGFVKPAPAPVTMSASPVAVGPGSEARPRPGAETETTGDSGNSGLAGGGETGVDEDDDDGDSSDGDIVEIAPRRSASFTGNPA